MYKRIIINDPINPISSPTTANIKSFCASASQLPFLTEFGESLLIPFPVNLPEPIAITEFSC